MSSFLLIWTFSYTTLLSVYQTCFIHDFNPCGKIEVKPILYNLHLNGPDIRIFKFRFQVQWNPLKVNISGPKMLTLSISRTEVKNSCYENRLSSLLMIVVPLSSVFISSLIYSCSVVNLCKLNLSKEKTTLSLKSGLNNLNNLIYYTQKHKICVHAYNSCYIFSASYGLGTVINFVLFSLKKTKQKTKKEPQKTPK